MKIKVNAQDPDVNQRLDLYLSVQLKDLTRSYIKKTIEANLVNVNGQMCFKAGYKVKVGDEIEFPLEQVRLHDVTKSSQLPKSPFDLEIILEDKDYLFINKPIGLTVHPTNSRQNDTLVNKLLSLNMDLPAADVFRPGIVHRLDKDTSGVIVVAKNPKSLWWLSKQFAERKIQKHYVSIGLAENHKIIEKLKPEFWFEGFMRRSSFNRKQFAMEPEKEGITPKGRYSKSFFKIKSSKTLQDGRALVLVEIHPSTGRTHQIRVHQKAMDFPILGDVIYLSRKELVYSEKLCKAVGSKHRLFLHAHALSFENYDGKQYSVIANLPKEYDLVFKNAQ